MTCIQNLAQYLTPILLLPLDQVSYFYLSICIFAVVKICACVHSYMTLCVCVVCTNINMQLCYSYSMGARDLWQ